LQRAASKEEKDTQLLSFTVLDNIPRRINGLLGNLNSAMPVRSFSLDAAPEFVQIYSASLRGTANPTRIKMKY